MSAVLGDFGFDQVDVLADIDAVDDRLLARILADDILVEIRKGTLVRRSGQTDDKGVKVGQHLAPYVVDRAVTFIDDDTIEKLRRVLGVVDDLFSRL